MEYAEKFKDPRWQKKRLEILKRDEWCCQSCFNDEATLHVHHKIYLWKKDPWEYDESLLITLCDECHQDETVGRKKEEKKLLKNLKKHFLIAGITSLAQMFDNPKFCHGEEVVISVLDWVMHDRDVQKKLIDDYFIFLSRKGGRK